MSRNLNSFDPKAQILHRFPYTAFPGRQRSIEHVITEVKEDEEGVKEEAK